MNGGLIESLSKQNYNDDLKEKKPTDELDEQELMQLESLADILVSILLNET
jgi:hypothetical protein